jgi:hypothetical protein
MPSGKRAALIVEFCGLLAQRLAFAKLAIAERLKRRVRRVERVAAGWRRNGQGLGDLHPGGLLLGGRH